MPGRKIDFYQGFLERGRPAFAVQEEEKGRELSPCIKCGYPTSSEICGVCRIKTVIQGDEL